MLQVYLQQARPIYLDKAAKLIFDEGVECFYTLSLNKTNILQTGNIVQILPWLGDQITNTVTSLLRRQGLNANCDCGVIDILDSSIESFYQVVEQILRGDRPTSAELAAAVPDTIIEKHDPLLPKEIRDLGYGARFFNVEGAWDWLNQVEKSSRSKVT
jgi:ATP-dependent Lhr-like helicase